MDPLQQVADVLASRKLNSRDAAMKQNLQLSPEESMQDLRTDLTPTNLMQLDKQIQAYGQIAAKASNPKVRDDYLRRQRVLIEEAQRLTNDAKNWLDPKRGRGTFDMLPGTRMPAEGDVQLLPYSPPGQPPAPSAPPARPMSY